MDEGDLNVDARNGNATVSPWGSPPDLKFSPFPLCAVKGVSFQWVQFPPGKVSLQPVAIGAAVEVTKPPEPSV